MLWLENDRSIARGGLRQPLSSPYWTLPSARFMAKRMMDTLLDTKTDSSREKIFLKMGQYFRLRNKVLVS